MDVKLAAPILELSGNLGDYYFKHINGKTFLCKRPNITAPPTPAQLKARDNFKNIYSKMAPHRMKKLQS